MEYHHENDMMMDCEGPHAQCIMCGRLVAGVNVHHECDTCVMNPDHVQSGDEEEASVSSVVNIGENHVEENEDGYYDGNEEDGDGDGDGDDGDGDDDENDGHDDGYHSSVYEEEEDNDDAHIFPGRFVLGRHVAFVLHELRRQHDANALLRHNEDDMEDIHEEDVIHFGNVEHDDEDDMEYIYEEDLVNFENEEHNDEEDASYGYVNDDYDDYDEDEWEEQEDDDENGDDNEEEDHDEGYKSDNYNDEEEEEDDDDL